MSKKIKGYSTTYLCPVCGNVILPSVVFNRKQNIYCGFCKSNFDKNEIVIEREKRR